MHFKTPMPNSEISVHGIKKALPHIASNFIDPTCIAEVSWFAELDLRDWGVKAIDISIQKVTVEIDWVTIEDEEESGQILIDTSNDHTWTIVDELEVGSSRVAPTEIEIDFDTKKITVK